MQQLSNQLKALMVHTGEEDGNSEAVIDVINKLEVTLRNVDGLNGLSKEELTEFVLSDNDPLTDDIDGVSDSFRDDVRELQHAIINHYS